MRVTLAVLIALALAGAPVPASAERLAGTVVVGAKPFGVAVDAVAGLVYVSNNGADTVSVVDAAAHTVVGTIPVGSQPGTLALDPARNRLWVSNFGDPSISVVDTAERKVVSRIPVGGLGIAVDPALARVYATNGASLRVIQADEDEVLATLSAGDGNWWGVAVNSETHRVYISDLDNDAVVVLDGETYEVLATIPMPAPSRFGLAADPLTNRIYVASFPSSDWFTAGPLRVVDGATNEIVRSIDLPGFSLGVALDPERQLAYVSNLNLDSVSVVDLAAAAVVAEVAVGPQPSGLALDAGREQVFVANHAADTVSVLGPNSPPALVSVTLTPAEPRTNDLLTASVVASDPDGDRLSYRFEWLRNGVEIAGATGPTLDLSVPGHGDRGDHVAVRVVVSDGTVESAPVVRSVVVANSVPVVTEPILEPARPRTNDTLSVEVSAIDDDGDAVTLRYQWLRDGEPIGGAADSTLDLALPGHGDKGDHITVVVVAADDELESEPLSSTAVRVEDTPPAVSVVLSNTAPSTREVLVATAIASDADGDPVSFTYLWFVDGALRQATTTTLTEDSFDLGRGTAHPGEEVLVEVIPSDGELSGLSATASATVRRGRSLS